MLSFTRRSINFKYGANRPPSKEDKMEQKSIQKLNTVIRALTVIAGMGVAGLIFYGVRHILGSR
jgi:hypothetical protein